MPYTVFIGSDPAGLYAFCGIHHNLFVRRITPQARIPEGQRAVKPSVRWRRAVSNVMLGIALGLISYYALTTAMGRLAQEELRDQSAGVDAFSSETPESLVAADAPDMDFGGWEAEDGAYWNALAEGEVFGRLVISDMGLDTLVIKGVSPTDLRRGPGWIDWSTLPGPTGTAGISGHRTTYGAPFRRLDELAEGDTIDLYSPYRRYRYRVTRSLVVTPDQTEVVAPTDKPSLTLTACHPPYSARFRLAVQADLIEVQKLNEIQE